MLSRKVSAHIYLRGRWIVRVEGIQKLPKHARSEWRKSVDRGRNLSETANFANRALMPPRLHFPLPRNTRGTAPRGSVLPPSSRSALSREVDEGVFAARGRDPLAVESAAVVDPSPTSRTKKQRICLHPRRGGGAVGRSPWEGCPGGWRAG